MLSIQCIIKPFLAILSMVMFAHAMLKFDTRLRDINTQMGLLSLNMIIQMFI